MASNAKRSHQRPAALRVRSSLYLPNPRTTSSFAMRSCRPSFGLWPPDAGDVGRVLAPACGLDLLAAGADLEVEARGRAAIEGEGAVGIGMLAEPQAERHLAALRSFEGRADIGQALGLQHEMMQPLAQGRSNKASEWWRRLQCRKVPRTWIGPTLVASRSLTPKPSPST